MSDTSTGGLDPQAGTQQSQLDQGAALTQAQNEALVARKENAFLKAGVDLTVPLNNTLLASYTGELTPDKVREYFDANGVAVGGAAAPATPPAGVTDDGSQAMRDMVANGGAPAGAIQTPEPSGREEAWKNFLQPSSESRSRSLETRQLELIDRYISGAAEGNREFIHDSDAWKAEAELVGHDFRPIALRGQPVHIS